MAIETVDLKSEERRRQVTLMLLGGLLLATTLPVVNQRALFSPLGDVPVLGDLSPVAYAMIVGSPPGIAGRTGAGRPGGFERPPVAYAARTPGDPFTGTRAPRGAYAAPPAGAASRAATVVVAAEAAACRAAEAAEAAGPAVEAVAAAAVAEAAVFRVAAVAAFRAAGAAMAAGRPPARSARCPSRRRGSP